MGFRVHTRARSRPEKAVSGYSRLSGPAAGARRLDVLALQAGATAWAFSCWTTCAGRSLESESVRCAAGAPTPLLVLNGLVSALPAGAPASVGLWRQVAAAALQAETRQASLLPAGTLLWVCIELRAGDYEA